MSELTVLLGLLFIAGSLGCEGPKQGAPLDNAAINAGLDPQDHRIVALVAHFEAHGIKLVHERGGWWRVTEPADLDYDVIVSLRAFPEGASADQLQDALARINLAYLLNARAHVAMSYPSLRGASPGATTEARFVALKVTLERLLQEYRPPPAKPGAASSLPHSMGALIHLSAPPPSRGPSRISVRPGDGRMGAPCPGSSPIHGAPSALSPADLFSGSLLGGLGGRRAPPCQCDLCGADTMRRHDAWARAARSDGHVRPIRRPG